MSAILTKPNKVSNTATSKKHISSETVLPKDFIDELFDICPNDKHPLYCSFRQPPSQGRWAASKISNSLLKKLYKPSDRNRYITVSTFQGERRRKVDFTAMIAVMVDDPGTKVPFENIALPPTYWLETSPGNYQAWYFLAEPITDRAYAESIVNAMVAQGLSKDGKDPGMKGVTRYGRLPGGWNNKESLETPHRVTAYEDTRGVNFYTAEQIVEAYELDLAAVASPRTSNIEGEVDQLDIETAKDDPIYKMLDSLGLIKYIQGHKIEITCPWVDDHTDGVDNGTALLIQPGGSLGFKCHHGHDEHKTLKDIHRWLKKNHLELYRKYYSVDEDDDFEKPQDSIKAELEQLLDKELSRSDIEARIPVIANKYGEFTPYDVRKILQSIEHERANAENAESVDLRELAKAAENDLDLYRVFPKPLAQAIESKCESDRVDPIRPVQTFLPTAASLLGSHTRVRLKKAINPLDNWYEYPHISTIDIGLPSSNKSQTMKTILNPIKQKQKQLNRDAQEKHEMWLQFCKVSEGETLDEPPPARKLYVTGGTSEGIQQDIADQPPRSGMLMVLDELAKLLSADQYKTGAKGSFKEFLLSAMTSTLGSGEGDVRKSKETMAIFEDQLLCIAGGIQPKRLKHLFDPESDDAGLGSRFLCAYPKLPPDYDKWSYVQVDIFDTLSGLFDYLLEVGNAEDEPITCVLSERAEKKFISLYESFRRIQIDSEHSNPGLFAFIGKCAGHLGRLTLLCHWIACYYEEEKPGKITLRSFNRGLYLLNYYIGKFRILQIQVSGGDENYGKLHLYILEQLKRKSELTDRGIRKRFNAAKKWQGTVTVHDVRQAFKDLAANDVGALINDGQGLKEA